MWTKIKIGFAVLLFAAIGVLKFLLGRETARADTAERKVGAMEGRRATEQAARAADKQAEAKGHEEIEEAVARARTGDRGHFE